MQRRQFETYLDKVFDWSARVAALPEGRQSPRHPWLKVFDGVFLGGAIQIPNVHRLEAECGQGVLRQRIGKLSEDAMGYALQREDPASIFALGCEVARRLKRNGVLGSSWARGRIVGAVDGIEICSSFVRWRCCRNWTDNWVAAFWTPWWPMRSTCKAGLSRRWKTCTWSG